MHLVLDRHPRGVLIGVKFLSSNGSSIRYFEDDAYKAFLSILGGVDHFYGVITFLCGITTLQRLCLV